VSLLEIVLRDLPARLRPAVERVPEHDQPDALCVWLNRRWGILLPFRGDDTERLTDIADQVQEWAVEERWERGESAVWPECPTHPDSHPLRAVQGAWHCPKTGERIAAIGQLLDRRGGVAPRCG
jgi:hypothetical protein